jgi:hypothetical protein
MPKFYEVYNSNINSHKKKKLYEYIFDSKKVNMFEFCVEVGEW